MHLYPVAFSADPSERPRVLHLVSDDGVAWSGDPDASVLEDFALELDEIGAIPSWAFVDADGTWIMLGGGRLPGGTRPIAWRATSPGPDGPWTAHPEPILEPSASGWDSAIVDHPTVIPTADGFLMAHGGAARGAPNRNRIGLATSDDGVTWTRVDATMDGADDEHALGPDACGIDARTMVEPHLLAVDSGQLLVFGVMPEGSDTDMRIVTAMSSDGRAWTCASGADSLGSDDVPGGRSIHSFAVLPDPDGAPSLLVEILGQTFFLTLAGTRRRAVIVQATVSHAQPSLNERPRARSSSPRIPIAFGPTPWMASRSFSVIAVSCSYRVIPCAASARGATLPIVRGNSVARWSTAHPLHRQATSVSDRSHRTQCPPIWAPCMPSGAGGSCLPR